MMEFFVPGLGPRAVSPADPLPRHLATIGKPMDARQEFWKEKSKWPRDAFGNMFLARALDAVGNHLFRQEWTGWEATAPFDLTPLSWSHHFAPRWQVTQLFPGGLSKVPEEAIKAWQEASNIRQQQVDALAEPLHRYHAAKEFLVEAMLNSTLPFRLRIDGSGDFTQDLPARFWNTELTYARFFYCQMNEQEPISAGLAGKNFRWIFVDAERLAALLQPAEHANTSSFRAKRKGAPDKYDWNAFRAECQRVWDYHGGFSDDDPSFSTPAHLSNQMADWCRGKTEQGAVGWPDEPASSTLRAKVKEFLDGVQPTADKPAE